LNHRVTIPTGSKQDHQGAAVLGTRPLRRSPFRSEVKRSSDKELKW